VPVALESSSSGEQTVRVKATNVNGELVEFDVRRVTETHRASFDGIPFTFTRNQMPLRLRIAITSHGCQSLTLDELWVMLDDLFGPGSAYVALSRVRDLRKVRLATSADIPRHFPSLAFQYDADAARLEADMLAAVVSQGRHWPPSSDTSSAVIAPPAAVPRSRLPMSSQPSGSAVSRMDVRSSIRTARFADSLDERWRDIAHRLAVGYSTPVRAWKHVGDRAAVIGTLGFSKELLHAGRRNQRRPGSELSRSDSSAEGGLTVRPQCTASLAAIGSEGPSHSKPNESGRDLVPADRFHSETPASAAQDRAQSRRDPESLFASSAALTTYRTASVPAVGGGASESKDGTDYCRSRAEELS
jgi:hypothetical protein